jgi:hypothetical protein
VSDARPDDAAAAGQGPSSNGSTGSNGSSRSTGSVAATATSPAAELVALLAQADAALARDDHDGAAEAMTAAADLCRRLQAAGVGVPASELVALRELGDRCGLALERMARELNAASFRGENHRRGIITYDRASRR